MKTRATREIIQLPPCTNMLIYIAYCMHSSDMHFSASTRTRVATAFRIELNFAAGSSFGPSPS